MKLVREKMNRALEIWKDLSTQSEGLSSPNGNGKKLFYFRFCNFPHFLFKFNWDLELKYVS